MRRDALGVGRARSLSVVARHQVCTYLCSQSGRSCRECSRRARLVGAVSLLWEVCVWCLYRVQWRVKLRAAPLCQPPCRPQTVAAVAISVRSCIPHTKLQRTCPSPGGRCRPLDTDGHMDIVTFSWAPWRVGCVVGGHARVRQTSWHPSLATSAPSPGGSHCRRLVWCVCPPCQHTQRRCGGRHGSYCHPQPRRAITVR